MLDQILEMIDFSKLNIADYIPEIVFAVVCLVIVYFLIINFRDINRFVVREYYFCATGLKKNTKMVVITDLHNKQYGRNNQVLWNAIELIAPDYILIAGDMITNGRYDNTPACELLRMLSSKYPVYYANGNHETKLKLNAEQLGQVAYDYEKSVSELPLKWLRNENDYIKDINLHIYGLDLEWAYYKRFRKKPLPPGYLKEKLGEPDRNRVNLLIAHNPEYFEEYAEWGADLVVSGHMHGGIIRLPLLGGVLSPRYTLFPEYDGGLYHKGKSTLILSRGTGTHILPLRIFNPGELVVVHMRH